MPAPIILGHPQNPYGNQAFNLLTQLALAKVAHKMRMEEMEAQAKLRSQEKGKEAEFQASLAGRKVFKTDSEKPPEGFTQNPWDTTSFIGPSQNQQLVDIGNGFVGTYDNGRLTNIHAKPKETEPKASEYQTFFEGFQYEHPELSGGALKKAASDAWQKRKIEAYRGQREVFTAVPTSTPGVFFDKARKQYFEHDSQGNEVTLSSQQVKQRALQFKEQTPTNDIKVMQQSVPSVLQLIGQSREALKNTTTGPLAGRWKVLWSSKIGAADPNFRKLKTDVDLLQTRLMKMHVGARGGEYIMKHFQDVINAGKDSPENMIAALDEIERYAKEVGQSITGPKGDKSAWMEAAKRANPKASEKDLSDYYDKKYGQ